MKSIKAIGEKKYLILPKTGFRQSFTTVHDQILRKYSTVKIIIDTISKYLKNFSYSPKKLFSVSRIIASTFKQINIEREELIGRLENKLESVNSTLFNYLRVSTIVICKDEWTPQNGILTPTMKIKRGNVDKMYMSKYNEWHHSYDKVIWE